MSKKLIGLLAVFGAVALSFAAASFSYVQFDRYHQHLEAPGPSFVEATGAFRTHLPVVSINTYGQLIPGQNNQDANITASLTVWDSGEGNNSLTDSPVLTTNALVRYRGNSSLHFDKKSFRIKLVDQAGNSAKVEMLGMPKEDEWVLNGPFLDKSLLRNYMMMNLSGQVMENTPEVRYCELFVNGEYRGLYLMMESISRSQAGVSKDVEGRAETSYIVRLDRGANVNLNTFAHYTLITHSVVNVVYPPSTSCTPQQARFIERDISKFEKSLYSLDYDDPKLGYHRQIDVSSFVDYMVLNEFFQNYDATRYSTYLTKPIGGKLSIGPVWDFNNALDNYMETSWDATGFGFPQGLWYNMLLRDEDFTNRVITRYRQLRKTILSDEYLTSYIDDTVLWLDGAVERNFAVWGYTFEPQYGLLEPADRNVGSHEEAVEQVKSFLLRRGAWLDENIELLYQYCHPSANKQYQH